MFRILCFSFVMLAISNSSHAEKQLLPQWGAAQPLTINITASPLVTEYASVAMYRWDASRQVGVLVETYAIPGLPMIPVNPRGGGGYIDPNSVGSTDRYAGDVSTNDTTSFPPIIVRGHRFWLGMMRLGYTMIDSYERYRAVRESNLAQCADAQRDRDRLQCDDDDGDEPPQLDCGAASNGFVVDTAPAAAGIFSNACSVHASCIRQFGASRSNCASRFRSAIESQCDTYYPTAGFPGGSFPPSEYRILNEGCRLQAIAYSVPGIGDAGLVAFGIWLGQYSNSALLDPMTVDTLPVSDTNWNEGQHRADCKDAGDREARFCQ